MPHVYSGIPSSAAGRYAVVVSRYNETITGRLLAGALDHLQSQGVPDQAVDVAWVPGAFELPTVAARLVNSRRYAAVLCLGAVIRGETTHDQHINRAISDQIAALGVRSGVPVLFGVLTCDTLEQAIHRSGGDVGNKGTECAAAALEMVQLLSRLPPTEGPFAPGV